MRKHNIRLIKNIGYLAAFAVVVMLMTLYLHCPAPKTSLQPPKVPEVWRGFTSFTVNKTNNNQLLLLTFGRSGSTFTSAIINHHPGVFFTSEPLHHMPKDIYDINISNSTAQKSLDTIVGFLNCEFWKLDPFILKSPLFEASRSTRNLYYCLRKGSTENSGSYAYLSCFLSMWKDCVQHNITFVKTIRFRVSWIREHMRQNPKLKLIFLVRDFRAMLHSHARVFKTFNFTLAEIPMRARNLCDMAEDQLKELLILKSLYPHRVKGVRYEDGSIDPVSYAKDIYEFAGLTFTDNIRQYVTQITRAKTVKTDAGHYDYGVVREDSVATMNKWRKSVDFSIAKAIDKECKHLYETFGYKTVNSEEELKSETHSLLTDPKPGGLF